MSNFETLLADAKCLSVPERIQLIEALWDTVPADSLPHLTDEWLSKIRRRPAEYDAGAVETTPLEQILAARIPKDYQPQEIDRGKPVGKEIW